MSACEVVIVRMYLFLLLTVSRGGVKILQIGVYIISKEEGYVRRTIEQL